MDTLKIVESVLGFGEPPGTRSSSVKLDIEELKTRIRESRGAKLAHQFFGYDPSADIAVACAAIEASRAVTAKLRVGKPSQTVGYWLVDVWGREEALCALVRQICSMLEGSAPNGVSAASFRSRVAVLVLGSEELMRLVGQGVLAAVPQELATVQGAVTALLPQARAAVAAHISDL